MRRAPRTSRGAAALEFALVMPLFVTLLVGGLTVAFALMTRYQLDNATAVAARACVINQQCNQGFANQVVVAALGGSTLCSMPVTSVSRSILQQHPNSERALNLFGVTATCDLLVMAGGFTITSTSAMPYVAGEIGECAQ